MKQFMKKHDMWLRLLSLLLAFVLWIVVRDIEIRSSRPSFTTYRSSWLARSS